VGADTSDWSPLIPESQLINRTPSQRAEPKTDALHTTVTRRGTTPRDRRVETRLEAGPVDVTLAEQLDERLLEIRRRLMNGDYDTPQVLAVVAERLLASGEL
jgi:hypothetical protein